MDNSEVNTSNRVKLFKLETSQLNEDCSRSLNFSNDFLKNVLLLFVCTVK